MKDDLRNRTPPTSVPEKRRLMIIKGIENISSRSNEAGKRLLTYGIVPILLDILVCPMSSLKIKQSSLTALCQLSIIAELKSNMCLFAAKVEWR